MSGGKVQCARSEESKRGTSGDVGVLPPLAGVRDLSTRVDKTVLSPEQFEVYSRLRDQRKIVAEKDRLPVFAI